MRIARTFDRMSIFVLLPLLFCGLWGGQPYPEQGTPNAHHYVYEHGQYTPQYYRYDPYPNYRAFSHNFPPFYTARNLDYYKGLDYGRYERFGRADNAFNLQ